MAASSSFLNLSLCVLFLCLSGTVFAQLSSTYYLLSCPLALSTIKTQVLKAVSNESRMGASLLRLHFHDCFVQGCDASVLLDDTANFTGEKTAFPNNNSLRGFDVIDKIKYKLEQLCPGVVSCADILTVAARDSVYALGGPYWEVKLGRKDSTTASFSDANKDLPAPFLNLSSLTTAFSHKNFTQQEMVALSGGHTIGMAKCKTFRNRIYNDTNIELSFKASEQEVCPAVGGDDNLSFFDATNGGNCFDNYYYQNLVNQKGLLHSDQELYNGGATDSLVRDYVDDSSLFSRDFANAMIKMSELTPATADPNAQVRADCRKVN